MILDDLSQASCSTNGDSMIRICWNDDFETIYQIVNDAAEAYRGVIPTDCWKTPYMPRTELQHEIDQGVVFWGFEEAGLLLGVMGMQNVKDVCLIRHAYVRSNRRNQGIGGKLLTHIRNQTDRPLLVGTWKSAGWATRFYESHGFKLVTADAKDELLREYWSISRRQIEASIVLADDRWIQRFRP